MPDYHVKFYSERGLTKTSEHFETFQAAHAHAAAHRPKAFVTCKIAIWELDNNGEEVGEPHLINL